MSPLSHFTLKSKFILIQEYLDIYTRKQDKNTKKENHFLPRITFEKQSL